jgi:hypothetical protein
LRNYLRGLSPPLTGAHDCQANCFTKLPILVAFMAGHPRLLHIGEERRGSYYHHPHIIIIIIIIIVIIIVIIPSTSFNGRGARLPGQLLHQAARYHGRYGRASTATAHR